MCRFLLTKFQHPTSPQEILERFANMSQKSKALDGDWQGDGWGVAWLDENKKWQQKRSLAPIWQEKSSFAELPPTKMLVAHARSASFPQHKGVIEFNQPYIDGKYAFVFNGLLKGVSLPGIPGRIGAEKIWHLLRQELKKFPPQEALENTKKILIENSREIVALNLGLATTEEIFSVNYFSRNPEYYTLHSWSEANADYTCSELL